MAKLTKHILPDRKEWRLDGMSHRENGPAVELNDGETWWFLFHERFTEEEEHMKRVYHD